MRLEIPPGLENIKNEKAYQTLVVDALRTMGWVVIHIEDMRNNETGTPDLACFRGREGQLIELKILGNYRSAGQKRWLERWVPVGTEVLLIYNRDADWEHLMDVMA